MHDYTGHSGDVATDGAGRATITIPKNTDGLGYVCYSRAGIGGGFNPPDHAVTQEFEGAADLDIPPADDTKFVTVGRVWAAAGKPIKGSLRFDVTDWTGMTSITLELDSPTGAVLASKDFVQTTSAGRCARGDRGGLRLPYVPDPFIEHARGKPNSDLYARGNVYRNPGVSPGAVALVIFGSIGTSNHEQQTKSKAPEQERAGHV